MRVIDPAGIAAVPWRNGAGTTRELWVEPGPDRGAWAWRLSLADLAGDADFSSFPGVDRVFTAIGGGFALRIDGRPVPVRAAVPIAFPGEAQVTPEGVASNPGRPIRALNLMCRRDLCAGSVQVRGPDGADAGAGADPGRGTAVALALLDGALRVDGTPVPLLGVVLLDPGEPIPTVSGAAARLAVVRIRRAG